MMRAIWEWCMDAALTPQILVNATMPGVEVPSEFVQDGAIVLNVHDRAVRGLDMGNEWVTFSARFAGTARSIRVPVSAVMAIYARENGEGLFFELPGQRGEQSDGEQPVEAPAGDDDGGKQTPRRGKPDLKLV
jgi:stringent starvation protein B